MYSGKWYNFPEYNERELTMSVKIKSDYAVFDRYKFYLDDVQKKVKEDCAF